MKIKNCPFCGGEAVTYSSDIDMYGNLMYGAMCKHTGCGVISCVYPSKEQAIEAWNRRTPLEEIVEQLEECEATCSGHKNNENNCGGCAGCVNCKMEDAFRMAIEIVKSGGKV